MNRKAFLTLSSAFVSLFMAATPVPAQTVPIEIRVDAGNPIGPMTSMWAWFGHDEPNYTYMPDGLKLLDELAEASPEPVFVRTHNLLTSGDGTVTLKWGSTNAYTEDSQGNPIYDWAIVDRIFDTYVERGIKPLVEIGFMPEALSTATGPYRHSWQPGDPYGDVYTGWAYPPSDFEKWETLVYEWVRHSVDRYGQEEVEGWWWEVWNEPDIGYWQGTKEEYFKLYDFAAAGLKRALPTARIGGPHVTGPNGERTQQFLRDFIEHTLRGTNYATGEVGSPLDYVGFHAKGSPRVMPEGHVRMSVSNQLRAIDNGFGIVASYPEIAGIPIVIGESDPEGCAACPVATDPHNAYRNGTMYSSYTAEQLARTYQLQDLHGVNLLGSVTWAFEFEDQPWFYGFRDLATNGVDKPVLNVFRMLAKLGGTRLGMTSDRDQDPVTRGRADSAADLPDISGLAATDETAGIQVFLSSHHDDWDVTTPSEVAVSLEGAVPNQRYQVYKSLVAKGSSNSYTVWDEMGRPQPPSAEQLTTMMHAAKLKIEFLGEATPRADSPAVTVTLPSHSACLVQFAPVIE